MQLFFLQANGREFTDNCGLKKDKRMPNHSQPKKHPKSIFAYNEQKSGTKTTRICDFGAAFLEAPPGIGPGMKVLQTSALPLGYGAGYLERKGYESIFRTQWSGLRGSNPPPPPWQGGALPNELNPRNVVPPVGIEPTTRGFSVPCSTD